MKLRLRQYKPCDADSIVSWIKDEDALRKWSSDRFGDFPITSEDINNKYFNNNGDCTEDDNFYPVTAFDENGVVGHLILRYTDKEKKVIRFGFVIVDDSKRGKGYGRQMLGLGIEYIKQNLGCTRVDLGVFDNNPKARSCYESAGFKPFSDGHVCDTPFGQWHCTDMELFI